MRAARKATPGDPYKIGRQRRRLRPQCLRKTAGLSLERGAMGKPSYYAGTTQHVVPATASSQQKKRMQHHWDHKAIQSDMQQRPAKRSQTQFLSFVPAVRWIGAASP